MKRGITTGLGVGLTLLFWGNLMAQTNGAADTVMSKSAEDSITTVNKGADAKSADVVDQSSAISQKTDDKNVVSANRTIMDDQKPMIKNIFPSNQLASRDSDIVYTPIGEGSMEVGQIASGYSRTAGQPISPIEHVWQQRAYSTLGYDVLIKKLLEINISGEGLVAFSTPQIGTAVQTMQTRNFFFLKTAFASYSIVNNPDFGFKIQAGFFPFKYNPDVRNLGEYLFRANAYPLLVYSDFDYPQADILGMHANFQYQTPAKTLCLQNDLLFHSEIYSVPVQDWSLSDVASATLFKAVTVGGGFSLCNWFSVYQGKYGGIWMDQNYYPDSMTANGKFYLRNPAGTDSALFDWKSTKVMARCSFDPKRFIPLNVFGENDFVLYGEADFIGLKNYPIFFKDLKDRTFYSAGFNVPCLKVLDVFNVELEYCRDTSAFSDENLFGANTPNIEPAPLINSLSALKVSRNQLRWSVYVKKTILDGHVSFIAQCARDHKKINFYYFDRQYMSFMETLPATSNWWWVFKTEFNF